MIKQTLIVRNMMSLKTKLKKIIASEKTSCLFIYILCFAIYLANGTTISSGDAVPNSLLAFNLLENHTVHLDAFKESYFCSDSYGNCYFFVTGNNGHLSSIYPIGTAIVSFPLYLIFYIYLKLTSQAAIPLDLTSASFEAYRLFFEKLAAAAITATTVTIFYLSVRLKFSEKVALISTLIFAFATNTWMTSSQGLWQHTASNLGLVSIIFCLLKGNRASQKNRKYWLVFAGVACGLLPGIRPTNVLYSIAAIVYSIFTYRFQSLFLLVGLVSAIPSIAWNLYYFSNFTGGYSKMFPVSPYKFNFDNFTIASLGTFISPSRGLLIFSPIVLYSLPGAYQVFKSISGKDEKLIGSMTIASLILLGSYCFYTVWWAGHSYGARFVTDVIPVSCYLISYFISFHFQKLIRPAQILNFLIFVVVIIFSIFVQFVGAFGVKPGGMWNVIPLNVDANQDRLWRWQDSQIERNAKAVLHKIIKPPIDSPEYIQGLAGNIKQVTDENNQAVAGSILVKPGSKKLLKANLENLGTSRWFGYESALERGEVRVRGRLYNEQHKKINEFNLYVSGTPKQHELTQAIAAITFPNKPGTYKLVFDLVSEGVGKFPKANDYKLTLIIK